MKEPKPNPDSAVDAGVPRPSKDRARLVNVDATIEAIAKEALEKARQREAREKAEKKSQ